MSSRRMAAPRACRGIGSRRSPEARGNRDRQQPGPRGAHAARGGAESAAAGGDAGCSGRATGRGVRSRERGGGCHCLPRGRCRSHAPRGPDGTDHRGKRLDDRGRLQSASASATRSKARLSGVILETGRPGRVETTTQKCGEAPKAAREMGFRSSVGSADHRGRGRLWGVLWPSFRRARSRCPRRRAASGRVRRALRDRNREQRGAPGSWRGSPDDKQRFAGWRRWPRKEPRPARSFEAVSAEVAPLVGADGARCHTVRSRRHVHGARRLDGRWWLFVHRAAFPTRGQRVERGHSRPPPLPDRQLRGRGPAGGRGYPRNGMASPPWGADLGQKRASGACSSSTRRRTEALPSIPRHWRGVHRDRSHRNRANAEGAAPTRTHIARIVATADATPRRRIRAGLCATAPSSSSRPLALEVRCGAGIRAEGDEPSIKTKLSTSPRRARQRLDGLRGDRTRAPSGDTRRRWARPPL